MVRSVNLIVLQVPSEHHVIYIVREFGKVRPVDLKEIGKDKELEEAIV